jgi:hypothetical protein
MTFSDNLFDFIVAAVLNPFAQLRLLILVIFQVTLSPYLLGFKC